MRVPRSVAVLAAGRAPVVWMESLTGVDNPQGEDSSDRNPLSLLARGFFAE